MAQISNRIATLEESATLAMASRARAMKAEGRDVIMLSIGEPDFDTPDFVKEAAIEAIHNNLTHYPPVPGFPELREAISEKFKRDNGLNYSPEQIVVSTGAKQSLINVVLSVVNPDDEVVLPAPFWVSYSAMVQLGEGVPVFINTEAKDHFKITPAQLENALTEKTRLFMFSSPSNPTGMNYTREELGALVEVFEKYPDVVIMADEIYEHLVYEGKHESIGTFESIADRVVTVNGVSKAFSMTGWRVGYIGAPLDIAKACIKTQGQFTSGTCSIAMKAAEAAIRANPDVISDMRDTFKTRRDMVHARVSSWDGWEVPKPQGAFYLFPDVSALFGKSANGKVINDANDLSEYILEEAEVAVVSGIAFENPNCIRLSYAESEAKLEEALSRIEKAINLLS